MINDNGDLIIKCEDGGDYATLWFILRSVSIAFNHQVKINKKARNDMNIRRAIDFCDKTLVLMQNSINKLNDNEKSKF